MKQSASLLAAALCGAALATSVAAISDRPASKSSATCDAKIADLATEVGQRLTGIETKLDAVSSALQQQHEMLARIDVDVDHTYSELQYLGQARH